jgi:hypothetical protein
MHRNACVLTTQKDKVWSCSEFDEEKPEALFSHSNPKKKHSDSEALMTLA